MPFFEFHREERKKSLKQWVIYSVGAATAVSLVVHFGNELLRSKHGEFVRDALCSVSRVLPDGKFSRLFGSMCRAAKDGIITPDEAKKIVGRGQQVAGVFSEYFDKDQANLELRAEDEVSHAIEMWKRSNPSPKIDPSLRKKFQGLSEEQLCVLSQAERYELSDGTLGTRYVGMSVCDEE